MSKNNIKSAAVNSTTASKSTPSTTLAQLEKTIQEYFGDYFKAAEALAQIRENKLYEPEFKTFEEYCLKRWGYSRSYGIRLADCHEVMLDLKPYEDEVVYPRNESQARVFVDLDKEQRLLLADTVTEKATKKNLTASDFAKFKKQLFPEKCTKKQSATPAAISEGEAGTGALNEVVEKAFASAKKTYAQLMEAECEGELVDDLKTFISYLQELITLNGKAKA